MSTILERGSLTYESVMNMVKAKNPNQPEFLQAVSEFAEVVVPFINANPQYQGYNLIERLTEPDRVFIFKVTWVDDNGDIQVNRAFRIQFNNAIGPYKGGLRLHPSVNLSILKFLGFEQVFKNSLTTLPMGGAKGGSDFDPKGKSDAEVMRFTQAFMTELHRHIGPNIDVPAGDIGVGGREIGFLYGQYKKLAREHVGVLTGKGMSFGGSLIRPEATGYGTIYFMREMLATKNDSFKGKTCLVSGSGNVAQYAVEKINDLGGKVVTLSDSSGTIYDPNGIDSDKLAFVMELKNVKRGRIKEYADKYGVQYIEGSTPWHIKADLAFPCATQNEIDGNDAKKLIDNGVIGVAEGANMPTNIDGINVFQDAGILYAPGKASNAGGVAVSGLEMSQNSLRYNWSREEVDKKLDDIMISIHNACVKYGKKSDGNVDYVKGANIAGFVKIADAVISQGVI